MCMENEIMPENKESLLELLKQEEILSEYSKILNDVELTCRGLRSSMCQGQGVINTLDSLRIKLDGSIHN